MKKQISFWKTAHYISSMFVLVGIIYVLVSTDSALISEVIRYSAKVGVFALALLFSIKNIALAHKKGDSKFTDFIRKQLPWQREQGLIAFNAFVLHAGAVASLILVHGSYNVGEYFYSAFTALIPTTIMIYLFLTSFKPAQRKIKQWKKTHSAGWVLFGTVLIHEFLTTKMFNTTTILATLLAFSTLLYGAYRQHLNKRTRKQLQFAILGFVLMGGMFLTNFVAQKPLLQIGLDDTGNRNTVSVEYKQKDIEKQVVKTENQPTAMKKYKDGMYEGRAQGNYDQVHLTVTIKDDKIQTIVFGGGNENQKYVSTLIGRIVEKQSTDVDGIGGATRTTNAVKSAASEALKKAEIVL